MRILHTADWHIGQTLNGWTREYEHRAFLENLRDLIVTERIDALLIAGDVFDGINPSGEAQRLLYESIASFHSANPRLQIVMTAGNHDPAQRLEAPEAVLAALGVHVIGTLRHGPDGVDMDRHLIGLRDSSGTIRAHVLAVPFLRAGDLPGLQLGATGGAEPAITAAARALHLAMSEAAAAGANGLPLLAMGHLTCAGGLESEGAERRILIGGEHAVPPDIFPPELSYVALGHLHRPQSLDAGRVRYSGSPFPLSAAEIAYDHGVTLLDLDEGFAPRHIPMPRPVAMHRLPARGAVPLAEVAAALAGLNLSPDTPRNAQPFCFRSSRLSCERQSGPSTGSSSPRPQTPSSTSSTSRRTWTTTRRSRNAPTCCPMTPWIVPITAPSDTLIAMLRSLEGATIEEIVAATGWLSHTVRGSMSGALKKKLGLIITSEKVDGRGRVYSIR